MRCSSNGRMLGVGSVCSRGECSGVLLVQFSSPENKRISWEAVETFGEAEVCGSCASFYLPMRYRIRNRCAMLVETTTVRGAPEYISDLGMISGASAPEPSCQVPILLVEVEPGDKINGLSTYSLYNSIARSKYMIKSRKRPIHRYRKRRPVHARYPPRSIVSMLQVLYRDRQIYMVAYRSAISPPARCRLWRNA